jgi:hypothetical protein
MEKQILVNQIRTPDGTILVSHHRHDYKTYIDKKNGLEYMVDGGNDYLRRNIFAMPYSWFIIKLIQIANFFGYDVNNPSAYKEISLYSDDPIEKLRESIHRGGRGKDGTEELKYVLIKDMSNDWIKNVIIYEIKYRPHNMYIRVFEAELTYRAKNKIFIED